MYSRILVAIDGSESSLAAVRESMRLAAGQPAAVLRLVMVAEVPAAVMTGEGPNLPAVERKVIEEAAAAVAQARAIVGESGLHVETATPESLGGPVADALLADARAWGAEVIVIGSHGRKGWRRLMMGSVAESVARAADRPVLLVRHVPEAHDRSIGALLQAAASVGRAIDRPAPLISLCANRRLCEESFGERQDEAHHV